MRTYPIAEIKTEVSVTNSLQTVQDQTNSRCTDRVLHWYFDFPRGTETDAVRPTTWPDSVVMERERKHEEEPCQPHAIKPSQNNHYKR